MPRIPQEVIAKLKDELRQHGITAERFDAAVAEFMSESALMDWANTTLTESEAHVIRDRASALADTRSAFWKRNGGMQLTMDQLARFNHEQDFPCDHATRAIFYTIALVELLVEEQINRMGQQS